VKETPSKAVISGPAVQEWHDTALGFARRIVCLLPVECVLSGFLSAD